MSRHKWFSPAAAIVVLLAVLGMGGAANAAFPVTFGSSPPPPAGVADDPLTAGVDCAQIEELGLDRQLNFRAAAILARCGPAAGPFAGGGAAAGKGAPARGSSPLAYGGTDRNIITGAETSPNVTQSETFIWSDIDAGGNTVSAAFNDSRGRAQVPINISGVSTSTDGGVTWTRVTVGGQSPFPGTLGDPVIYYNRAAASNRWHAVWLSQNCGTQGLGEYVSNDALTWTADGCVHSGTQDDRESGWVDATPGSPFYGRMYISWNDFNIGGGALFVTYSTDNGATWSAPVNVFSSFRRNVQMTGSTDGTVFIQTMDEGGGGLAGPRQNYIYRSTNGGATWTQFQQNAGTFSGPGRGASGYFAVMYTAPAYWRHMGWGQPGVSAPNIIHYAYADRPAAADPGNIQYIRSTDNGATWSAPIQMNTDATTRAQWMPSLSAGANGGVFVSWYDERETAACAAPGVNTPCYRRWGRLSTDNGATWQPDQEVGDVVSPLPAQPDPGIQATYAGDYDYAYKDSRYHYTTWTDGRVLIGGQSQQDVFFDRIGPKGTPTATATATPTRTATATHTRTATVTPTRTATPTVPARLVGHVTWQGRPSQPHALNQLPITLTLKLGANPAVHYPNQTTDASGFFTVTVTGLPSGVYNWWVKGPQYLASNGTVSLTGALLTQQEMGTQRAGDVNNDNLVDITDFTLLRATFGLVCGNPGYDGRADFTGNCLVDITDFTLQRGNFGLAGPPQPTGPEARPAP